MKRYDVEKWAHEFLSALEATKELKEVIVAKKMTVSDISRIKENYKKATKRLLLLDYDGTLVGFKDNPQDAKPDEDLFNILDNLQLRKKITSSLLVVETNKRLTIGLKQNLII